MARVRRISSSDRSQMQILGAERAAGRERRTPGKSSTRAKPRADTAAFVRTIETHPLVGLIQAKLDLDSRGTRIFDEVMKLGTADLIISGAVGYIAGSVIKGVLGVPLSVLVGTVVALVALLAKAGTLRRKLVGAIAAEKPHPLIRFRAGVLYATREGLRIGPELRRLTPDDFAGLTRAQIVGYLAQKLIMLETSDHAAPKVPAAAEIRSHHLAVLGLGPSATESDIKHAFYRLSRACHPDRFPGDKLKEAQFKKLAAARDALYGSGSGTL